MDFSSLNEAQRSIIQFLAEPLTPEELEELRKLIVKFRYERLQKMLTEQREQQGWTQEILDEWYNEHLRTPRRK